jgi:hypothetical protein
VTCPATKPAAGGARVVVVVVGGCGVAVVVVVSTPSAVGPVECGAGLWTSTWRAGVAAQPAFGDGPFGL